MEQLERMIDQLIKRRRLRWSRSGAVVEVELWEGGRRQKVHLSRRGVFYVFWSQVAPASLVTKSDRAWRELAYRAWRKNDLKEIVTFSFDDRGRLIGVIEQPAESLDAEELELYVGTLARECDRFEYQLTGEDRE